MAPSGILRWILSRWKPENVDNVVSQHGGKKCMFNMCRGTIAKSVQRVSDVRYLKMNQHQCLLLVKKLSETEKTLKHIQQFSNISDSRTTLVLQELHQALLDADKLIIQSSISTAPTSEQRLRAAIDQSDMKETFSKVLYEVHWHTEVLQSILLEDFRDVKFDSDSCTGKLIIGDELCLLKAMEKDEKSLKDLLISLQQAKDLTQRQLADQLLRKMEATVEDHQDLNTEVTLLTLIPENPKDYYCGVLLGRGSYGSVRVTNILGGEYAIKIFEQVHTPAFNHEKAALKRLGNHPHVVRILCYSEKETSSDCFFIMEKLDMDLSEFLNRRTIISQDRRLLEAVVLMLQIAEGVRYIHCKNMAHRDLKPGNVLVSVEDRSEPLLSRARSVKIADFGLTKTKNTSRTHSDQTVNTGTTKYMAPEVIKAEGDPRKAKLNPKKADSYSFAIMCFEILTGEDPWGNLLLVDIKKKVKADIQFRPPLPVTCPLRLKSLIQRCWAHDFHTRPLFPQICQELRFIKALLLLDDQRQLATDVVSNTLVERNIGGGSHSIDVSASTKSSKCIKQGPWGREEPHKKTGLFDYVADSIKWMRLKYQQTPPAIGFLEVGYVSGDEELTQTYLDKVIGITWHEIQFAADEYIKQVSGCVATHEVTVRDSRGKVGLYCVVSLTIHTNQRDYGPFGDDSEGKKFKSGTGKVCGFFGAGNVLLDKLGVWIVPDGQEEGDQSYLIEQ